MFQPITEKERYNFWTNSSDNFIPGYTGHCPTLRFQYGKPYGTETKEILHDLRDKEIFNEVQRHRYREDDARKIALVPISRAKDQAKDYALDPLNRSPKYILGYTGFIPTLNFRYGKSFGRTADDSMADFTDSQSRLREKRAEMQSLFRTQSAPRMVSIRNRDEVTRSLTNYETLGKFNGECKVQLKAVQLLCFQEGKYHPIIPRSPDIRDIYRELRVPRRHFLNVTTPSSNADWRCYAKND
uniref:Ciliary microtubule inner protein 2A-C-like domain-containing protein n=1 Tax=Photinus pyralis TaxID=7054 RepID=A0A1Y1LF43_PHOPY